MQLCNSCKIMQMLDAGVHLQASGHVTQYFKPKYTKEFAILYLIDLCIYREHANSYFRFASCAS